MIFIEDTTGFLPGRDQESRGIVQAGRAMLDAIIDLRTPRILLILRNAFGGAYAAFNCYATGADIVLALPTTRVAVMGTAGKEYVYKDELQQVRARRRHGARRPRRAAQRARAGARGGASAPREWLKAQEAELNQRYERELMNPREALSPRLDLRDRHAHRSARASSPATSRFLLRHYVPGPMVEPQREFH